MRLCPDTQNIRRLFEMLDENGDGKVTVPEINCYLKRLGMDISEEELKYVVAPISESEDGSLTFDGFVRVCESILGDKLNDGDGGDGLREAFKVYDMNNDGFISPTELQQVLSNLGLTEGEEFANCQKMINSYDSDGNGLLDFSEFKNMMTSKTPAQPSDRHESSPP